MHEEIARSTLSSTIYIYVYSQIQSTFQYLSICEYVCQGSVRIAFLDEIVTLYRSTIGNDKLQDK